jgi:endonuclease YncB( thermonuclease family)
MPAAPERGESAEVASGAHAPIPAVPKQFSGIAHVMGAAALQVDKVPVQLYGIREPTPHDRCGVGDAADCVAAAKRALAAHIAGATISCQTPSPKPGIIVAFAVCLDGQGVDLGGFLVAEGLALADTGQTYDYAGAESIARGQKRGLWGFR